LGPTQNTDKFPCEKIKQLAILVIKKCAQIDNITIIHDLNNVSDLLLWYLINRPSYNINKINLILDPEYTKINDMFTQTGMHTNVGENRDQKIILLNKYSSDLGINNTTLSNLSNREIEDLFTMSGTPLLKL